MILPAILYNQIQDQLQDPLHNQLQTLILEHVCKKAAVLTQLENVENASLIHNVKEICIAVLLWKNVFGMEVLLVLHLLHIADLLVMKANRVTQEVAIVKIVNFQIIGWVVQKHQRNNLLQSQLQGQHQVQDQLQGQLQDQHSVRIQIQSKSYTRITQDSEILENISSLIKQNGWKCLEILSLELKLTKFEMDRLLKLQK